MAEQSGKRPQVSESNVPLKKRRSEEGKRAKKESDRNKQKSRIYIGYAFERWRKVKEDKKLIADSDVANYLLDCYDSISQGPAASTPVKGGGVRVRHSAPSIGLSSIAEESEREANVLSGLSGHDEEREMDVLQERDTDNEDIDEDEVNNLMNSIIDWSDDIQDPERGNADPYRDDGESSDDDYVPNFCIRTGGALKTGVDIQSLPVIATEDTVHDAPDIVEPDVQDEPPFPQHLHVLCEDDIVGQSASIVFEASLMQLVKHMQLPITRCTWSDTALGVQCDGVPPFEVNVKKRGTGYVLEWTCSNGHQLWKWNSQPTFKFGMQAGDFLMATNILLSGNNYSKIALLFKLMNMRIVSQNTFYAIQDEYCVDTIKSFWHEERRKVLDRLSASSHIVALGDGRMDSPGHCAQYCTYTTIENDSRDIINIVTVDKRETNRSSVLMEKEAFIRTLDSLLPDISLKEFCTDGHTQIAALMDPVRGKYKEWGLKHTLDMWHAAKSLSKRLHAAGMIKSQSEILMWMKDIISFFWQCCQIANTYREFMGLWRGVLHHVTGRHEWAFGKCQHQPLPESEVRSKPWIVAGSPTHQALTEVILNPRWLKSVPKYLSFRSTSDLEEFHSHMLMYASKRYSFDPPAYEARTLLAALDYNFHNHRPPMLNKKGKKVYNKLWNKKAQRWSVYSLKTKKEYAYIPDLQKAIVGQRLQSGKGIPLRRKKRPDDPRRLGLLPPIPPPSVEELVQTQVKRGQVIE